MEVGRSRSKQSRHLEFQTDSKIRARSWASGGSLAKPVEMNRSRHFCFLATECYKGEEVLERILHGYFGRGCRAHPDGPKASNALTIKLDYPIGAHHTRVLLTKLSIASPSSSTALLKTGDPTISDFLRKHRSKTLPPKLDRLATDHYNAFVQ